MRALPCRAGSRGAEGFKVADRVAAPRFETAPGHLLRRAQQVHTDLWSTIVGPELTGPQYGTLVAVAGWPEVDQKRAGELISLDKSTTAGVVARLEKKGWLTRRPHPRDGRRRLLTLTDRARANLPVWTSAAAQVQQDLLEPLDVDQAQEFIRQLQLVVFHSETEALSEAPIRTEPVVQLAGSPGYLIRRAQQVHATIWSTVFGGDLTGPQYAVMLAVANGESIDQALIGARASLDSSSVTDIVARLAEKGWLVRARDPVDRRRMRVRLTQPAMTAMPHLSRSAQHVQDELLRGLSADGPDEFIDRLRRVARVNEPTRDLVAAG